jgi:hypothetical protein
MKATRKLFCPWCRREIGSKQPFDQPEPLADFPCVHCGIIWRIEVVTRFEPPKAKEAAK